MYFHGLTKQEATCRVVISLSVILNVSLHGFSFTTWRKTRKRWEKMGNKKNRKIPQQRYTTFNRGKNFILWESTEVNWKWNLPPVAPPETPALGTAAAGAEAHKRASAFAEFLKNLIGGCDTF